MAKEIHHRKPVTLFGDHSLRNTLKLEHDVHMWWHQLVANLPAHEILREFNNYLDPVSFETYRPYQKNAWRQLFGGMSPHEIAHKVNELFLDPDYKMYFHRKKFILILKTERR